MVLFEPKATRSFCVTSRLESRGTLWGTYLIENACCVKSISRQIWSSENIKQFLEVNQKIQNLSNKITNKLVKTVQGTNCNNMRLPFKRFKDAQNLFSRQ